MREGEKMSSKYDRYWSNRLSEIAQLIREAYRDGISGELNVSDLRKWGNRQSWYGAVEISKDGLEKKSGAHATSLGQVVYSKELIAPYCNARFRMVISQELKLGVERIDTRKTSLKITISEEMYKRLQEFKRIVEAVVGEEINLDDCGEIILGLGIDHILEGLLEEPSALLQSFQRLGAKYPDQVYGYIAEIIEEGALVEEQERVRKRLGFQKPS